MKNIKLKSGKVLKVIQDDMAESPRSWDNLSKMIFFGKHSHLGDSHNFKSNDYEGFEEMKSAIVKELDAAVIVPIYGYSHGSLTISTKPFSCQWDSGQLGFAVVTKEDIRKNYSIKRVTKKYVEKAEKHIEGEVETLEQFISNEIYGFILEDENEEEIDSCWGFYGDNVLENGIIDNFDKDTADEVRQALAA